MTHTPFTVREEIVETVNKLFIYTDNREWQKLLHEVFAAEVLFDMSSLSGEKPSTLPASSITDMWSKGFEGIDAVHHQAGNYLVTIKDNEAEVYAYAIALHYKNAATQGKTREFVGTYNIHLTRVSGQWRIDGFKYNLKYMTGNPELK